MATTIVEFDVDEHLQEASDDALRDEIQRRIGLGTWRGPLPSSLGARHIHPWTPEGVADDLETAYYARNASRHHALCSVLRHQREMA